MMDTECIECTQMGEGEQCDKCFDTNNTCSLCGTWSLAPHLTTCNICGIGIEGRHRWYCIRCKSDKEIKDIEKCRIGPCQNVCRRRHPNIYCNYHYAQYGRDGWDQERYVVSKEFL